MIGYILTFILLNWVKEIFQLFEATRIAGSAPNKIFEVLTSYQVIM